MKYAILGAGAMGSIIGGVLAKGGQEVLLVDPYKEHLDKIQQDSLKLKMVDKTETCGPNARRRSILSTARSSGTVGNLA